MSRSTSLLLIASIAAATLLSSVASAESPQTPEAADTVHLRSGGSYRGRVTEVLPGDHVTIVSEGGEPKRVPWSDIERLVLPSVTRSEAAAPTPAPAPPPPFTGPLVRVHISSKASVNLHRRPVGSVDWVEACVSPCDKELPAGDGYRITGTGIAERELLLHADGAKTVDIRVDPPSTPGMVGGGLVAGLGASVAFLGYLYLPSTCFGENAGCAAKEAKGTGTTAGIMLGTGAAAAVVGTLIFVFSAKTDVAVAVDGKERPPPPSNREPTWRGSIEAPPMKLPFAFTRTF